MSETPTWAFCVHETCARRRNNTMNKYDGGKGHLKSFSKSKENILYLG